MRLSFVTVAVAAFATACSAPGNAEQAAARQDAAARAKAFVELGTTVLNEGKTALATDAFEAAVAADPASVPAYLGLARIAKSEGLPGKAIRHYRTVLALNPNLAEAQVGEGVALAQKGALALAKERLATFQKSCAAPCAAAVPLSQAIAEAEQKAAAALAMRPAATDSTPVPGEAAIPIKAP